ncbi:hypothetical protein BH769_gp85 [Gordonia phage BritBrat]|uniref:Uncharacterized protein n=1 Tax=Gordonia phage BritBrat TaxID=1838064 RepID=A0A166Y0T5_9CAUD|nr:hypothetical protein BH769_gp85 [Gordonia phage BritBrat]ANA85288.1 hypothetical protein PBI_BRITBRAT_85 [Gordonia phage BritBrat]QSL99839.1 hypothetical protein SEA_ODAY_95 [Gordonia phage ODay]
MSRMLRSTFKKIGRCHPWCGNQEYEIGRAAEKREWRKAAHAEGADDYYRDEEVQ